jgi:hypothetical protein
MFEAFLRHRCSRNEHLYCTQNTERSRASYSTRKTVSGTHSSVCTPAARATRPPRRGQTYPNMEPQPPPGLSKLEVMKWKRQQKRKLAFAGHQPAPGGQPPAATTHEGAAAARCAPGAHLVVVEDLSPVAKHAEVAPMAEPATESGSGDRRYGRQMWVPRCVPAPVGDDGQCAIVIDNGSGLMKVGFRAREQQIGAGFRGLT